MINYELAILIAVLAIVYTNILTQGGHIFNGLYNKLDKFFNTDKRICEGKSHHPLFKILIQCELCFSGQFSLWIFIIFNYNNYLSNPFTTALQHVLFISLTIFCTSILKSIYKKIK